MAQITWRDRDGDRFKLYQDEHAFAVVQIADVENYPASEKEVYMTRTQAKRLLKWLEDALA